MGPGLTPLNTMQFFILFIAFEQIYDDDNDNDDDKCVISHSHLIILAQLGLLRI